MQPQELRKLAADLKNDLSRLVEKDLTGRSIGKK